MREFLYNAIKVIIRAGFFCYYKTIAMHNMDKVPANKPVLLLANHQNALIDALLVAAYSNRAPFFLTRSDVFKNNTVIALFNLLKMLPVYRMRDGRDTLNKNIEIFDTCADLLNNNEAILLFPEANHNIRRRVRPLSKGFTRILFRTLDKYPDLDVLLAAVGVNYKNAAGFPDSAAFFFGQNFSFRNTYTSSDLRVASLQIRARVSEELKKLTTHIDENLAYEEVIDRLQQLNVDYLKPHRVNPLIEDLPFGNLKPKKTSNNVVFEAIWDFLFTVLNAPILLLWRGIIKKRVKEIEFISTHRFLFSLLFYPLFYLFLLLFLTPFIGWLGAVAIVVGIFVFNLMYVKLR